MGQPAIEMRSIVKQFPGVTANDGVDFSVKHGSIHGLVGENGAGKTTLMNLLYGLYQPDYGEILIGGDAVELKNPHDAIDRGVGMVHQHFMLVPSLTVLENIVLGRVPTKFGINRLGAVRKEVRDLANKYSLSVHVDRKVAQLSVGEMQRVEILKALYRGADVLILDEPTAVLVPQEVTHLFEVLRQLSSQGHAIILITHKLKEVLAVTDYVTVMRRGKVTGNLKTSDTNEQQLANMMVGRDVVLRLEKPPARAGETALALSGVCAEDERHQEMLHDIDLIVRRGEIVGLAGVEGNGQTQLIEAISGLRAISGGTIHLGSVDISHATVRRRRELGMGHVPEDRLAFGVARELTIADNLILNRYYRRPLSSYGVLSPMRIQRHCEDLIERFRVKTNDETSRVGTLSGGNMQKVVLARELESDPIVLIAAQPGRGVDVGAIEEIYRLLVDLRDRGNAILLVSSELEDILMLSDSIAVMCEGRIVARLDTAEASEKELGLYMSGAKVQQS